MLIATRLSCMSSHLAVAIALAFSCEPPALSGDRDYYFNQALSLVYNHHLHDALPLLNRVIVIDPNFADAYYQRGNLYLELEDREKAKEDLDKAIKLNSARTDVRADVRADAYEKRARLFYEEGKKTEAMRDVDVAIKLNPKGGELYKFRFKMLLEMNQNEKALADICKGIELEPQSSSMRENRARVYTRMGQLQKALADYNEAVKLEERGHGYDEKLFAERAKVYDKLGKKDLAEKDRKRVRKDASEGWGFLLDK
jgi:tetratricopeptide (TPR) repeat protein